MARKKINNGLRENPLTKSELTDLKMGLSKINDEFGVDSWDILDTGETLESIANVDAYLEFAHKKVFVEQNKTYTTVHGDELSMALSVQTIKARTRHYSAPEQEEVLAYHKKFNSDHITGGGGILTLSRKAFIAGYKQRSNIKKFSKTHYDVIIGLYARQYQPNEIMSYMRKEHSINYTLTALREFQKIYSDEIEKQMKSFQNNIADIRLSHKSSRLEQYQELYERLKHLFYKTNKTNYSSEAMRALELVRKEVEGNTKKLEIDINGNININHALSIDNQQQIIDNIHIYDIIIGRVASKAGKNPLIYINALRNSFYADILGFGNKNKEEAEIRNLPSEFNFDLTKLEEKYKKFSTQQEEIETIELFETQENTYSSQSKLDVLKKFNDRLEEMKASKKSAEGLNRL